MKKWIFNIMKGKPFHIFIFSIFMVLETISHALQSKEEKKIVANKKHQLCALLLHISQDLISGNG